MSEHVKSEFSRKNEVKPFKNMFGTWLICANRKFAENIGLEVTSAPEVDRRLFNCN